MPDLKSPWPGSSNPAIKSWVLKQVFYLWLYFELDEFVFIEIRNSNARIQAFGDVDLTHKPSEHDPDSEAQLQIHPSEFAAAGAHLFPIINRFVNCAMLSFAA